MPNVQVKGKIKQYFSAIKIFYSPKYCKILLLEHFIIKVICFLIYVSKKQGFVPRIRNNKDSAHWDSNFDIDFNVEDRLGSLWGVFSWSLWQL